MPISRLSILLFSVITVNLITVFSNEPNVKIPFFKLHGYVISRLKRIGEITTAMTMILVVAIGAAAGTVAATGEVVGIVMIMAAVAVICLRVSFLLS